MEHKWPLKKEADLKVGPYELVLLLVLRACGYKQTEGRPGVSGSEKLIAECEPDAVNGAPRIFLG
jgi:hypothetical protein